ncbi:MAG TPA: hypothetical protein VEL76_32580 [Gemmataceae bacterium]|nr:hypothetical protein [Gemmataceae bacterium]
MMHEPPGDYRETDEMVMSNFDRSIDQTLTARLRAERVTMHYSGRGFCGEVWFRLGQFHCLIRIHGLPQETVSRDTLEEVMEYVCLEYASE